MKKKIIRYVNFTKLPYSELCVVLKERNSDRIRKKMVNDQIISLKDHLSFCHSLSKDFSKIYVQVKLDNDFIGVIDSQNIDYDSGTYEPGCYFKENVEENVVLSALSGFSLFYINNDLRIAHIKVLKNNIQAFLFNMMKCGARLVGEDENVYFLINDFLDTKYRPKSELKKIILENTKNFDLEFDL